jgi:2-polyprenyl-6-methoxyphenol hydroxylase-like FAD-dependent oxidoreductase
VTLSTVPRYDAGRVPRVGGRAVVVGASVAGLLAARVLADAFREVVVVDRDPLPDEAVVRRGVPQANHVHVLLEASRATLADLFPGYCEELLAAGGVAIDAATTVRGVATVDAAGDDRELAADLVVDATGRRSRTPDWLERHGYPPADPRGFEAFAGSLPTPALRRLLDAHRWLDGEIHRYPFPSNRRRRYEALRRFPDGLLVTGDAIASFNPIYGQGMSVAALDALQLHHALASGGLEDLAPRFFERAAAVVDVVWRMAVGADFEFPGTEGPKPRGTDLFNRYLTRLIRTAHADGQVADQFSRVLRLEQPPTTLLALGVLWRVLAPQWLTRRAGGWANGGGRE